MALTPDATVTALTAGTGTISGNHTPAAACHAILVKIAQVSTTTDQVSGVTADGVAMTRSRAYASAATAGAAYMYEIFGTFPAGTPVAIVVTVSGAATRQAVVEGIAAGSGVVEHTAGEDATRTGLLTNAQITVPTAAGKATLVHAVASISDSINAVSVTSPATQTHESGTTSATRSCSRQTGAGGNVLIGWTYNNDNIAAVGVAYSEGAGGNPPVDLSAASGASTAAGGTLTLAVTVQDSGGSATAAGGSAAPRIILPAASGAAFASGGSVTVTSTVTDAAGGATAAGGTSSLTVVLAAAGGSASGSGGSVTLGSATNLSVTGGSATAAGGSASLAETVTASSGTAAATGGTVTLRVALAAVTGSASASGGAASATRAYPAQTGTASASGGTTTIRVVYTATGTSVIQATADGGLVIAAVGSPPDTHPALGGVYDETATGGVYDEASTGGRITVLARGGTVRTLRRGGRVQEPSRSGTVPTLDRSGSYDETATGGEVL